MIIKLYHLGVGICCLSSLKIILVLGTISDFWLYCGHFRYYKFVAIVWIFVLAGLFWHRIGRVSATLLVPRGGGSPDSLLYFLDLQETEECLAPAGQKWDLRFPTSLTQPWLGWGSMLIASRCSSTDTVCWGKSIFFLVNIVSSSSLLGLFSDATTGKGWRVHCYCWVGWKSMIPTEPHSPRAGMNAMASYSAVSDMTSVGA